LELQSTILKLFKQFDIDGNGVLDRKEARAFMEKALTALDLPDGRFKYL